MNPQWRSRLDRAAPFAITAVGAALRIFRIDFREFWFDEAYGALLAGDSLAGIVAHLKIDTAPPLYYILLKIWSAFFGNSDAALRSMSALAGIAIIPLAYVVAKALFDRKSALIAAILVAFNPLAVMYSQEARMYTITPLLTLAALKFLLDAFEKKSIAAWACYVAAQTALLYTHYHGMFLLPAAWIAFVVGANRSKTNFIKLAAAQACALLLFAPWVPVIAGQAASPGAGTWIGYYWTRYPPSLALLKSIASMLPAGPWPEYIILDRGNSAAWLAIAAVGWIVAATGIAFAFRNAETRGKSVSITAFALTAIAIPWIVSLAGKPIFVVGRYEIGVYPLILIAVAAGVARLPRIAQWSAIGVTVAVSLATLIPYYNAERPDNYRARALAIEASTPKPAAVVFVGTTRAPVEHYLSNSPGTRAVAVYPPFLENDPGQGWFDRSEIETSPAKYSQWALALVNKVSATTPPGGAVAVVEELHFADGMAYRWRGEALLLDAFANNGYSIIGSPVEGVVFLKRSGA